MNSLLSTAYWPNLHYFYYLLNSDTVCVEQFENYQKQSYRNRAVILTANGPLDLSIPVSKKNIKELTKDIEISYTENWQTKHWRAIESAYRNSPYFEHFESEISDLYTKKHKLLLDFNLKQLELVFKILRVKKTIALTTVYEHERPGFIDMREKIHPKIDFRLDASPLDTLEKPYYQTFEAKFAYVPNLSILDLLFNTGLETVAYFRP